MPFLLAFVLAATPAVPPSPALVQSHLSAPQGVLLPAVSGHRGGRIASGVSNIVAGSILLGLGAASAVGGVAALVGAGALQGDAALPLTVVGWTFTGLGILLGVIGVPLLIVGISNVSRPGVASLALTQDGQLAVVF